MIMHKNPNLCQIISTVRPINFNYEVGFDSAAMQKYSIKLSHMSHFNFQLCVFYLDLNKQTNKINAKLRLKKKCISITTIYYIPCMSKVIDTL